MRMEDAVAALAAAISCLSAGATTVRYVDEFDLSASRCGFGLKTAPRLSVPAIP